MSPGRQPWEEGRFGGRVLKERLNETPLQGESRSPVFPGLAPWAKMNCAVGALRT